MCSDSALRQLANLERMIDIMSVKLIQFRDLGLNEFSLSEIRRLEVCIIFQVLFTIMQFINLTNCFPDDLKY